MADNDLNNEIDLHSREFDLRRELELEKIKNDFNIKQQELGHSERKIALEEKTLNKKGTPELKIALISVISAAVAAAGTFTAAYLTGLFDVEKTNASSAGTINVAKLQFSNELIKSALSSNNPANSLLFYADIGLLEGLKSENVKRYANNENKRIEKGDEGASLLPSFANAAASNSRLWLNADSIKQIAPNANPEIIIALSTLGNYIFTGFDINKNKKRLSMFIGQIAYETDGFRKFVENANYSESRLMAVWPTRFDEKSARAYANTKE